MLHDLVRISCARLSINEPISNLTNLLSQITTAGIKLCKSVTSGAKKIQLVSNLTQLKVNIFAWHHHLPSTIPSLHVYGKSYETI